MALCARIAVSRNVADMLGDAQAAIPEHLTTTQQNNPPNCLPLNCVRLLTNLRTMDNLTYETNAVSIIQKRPLSSIYILCTISFLGFAISLPTTSPPSSAVPRREYWMIYRGPGFLAVVWFSSSLTPLPPSSVQHVVSLSKSSGLSSVSPVKLTDGRGVGGVWRIWRRESLVLY